LSASFPVDRLLPFVLAAALNVGFVAPPTTEPPLNDRGVIVVGQGPRYTPLGPEDIIDRADIPRAPAFATRPFRVTSYSLQTLEWAALSWNGLTMPSLAKPANSDADGIAYKVVDGRNYYSPGTLASRGVQFVDAYVRTGNPAYLDRAKVRAQKLVRMGIRVKDALYFPYPFDWPREGLEAPWVSGYAQGFALSLFVRLYRVTGEWNWADHARSTFMSFRQIRSGSRHWVAYAPTGDLWLEEYPARRPTHVLNGFCFALAGLYDYERLTRDPVANQMVQGGLSTMRRFAASYRLPGRLSLYDLVHRRQASQHYHDIHVWQLADLGAISGDAYFRQLSASFDADH
jgi:hypothetical protein